MSRLNNAVQKVNSSSGLTGGRTSIKCTDIAEKYPEGIHVTGIGQNEYDGKKYYVYTFIEEPNKYFSSGKVLTEKTDSLLETYDGNLAELNKDLSEEYLQLFLAKKRGEKYTYINAGFGNTVPAANFGKPADGEVVDEETGEVLQPAQPATITQDGISF